MVGKKRWRRRRSERKEKAERITTSEDSNNSLFHLFDGFAQPASVFAEEASVGRLRIVRGDVGGGQKEFRKEWQFHVDARLGIRRFGRLWTTYSQA